MKTRSLIKKAAVIFLCLCMLLSLSISSGAVSADAGNNTAAKNEATGAKNGDVGSTGKDSLTMDSTATLVKTEGLEVISLREENVKHFDMGNGTYQAISYSHPVHQLDSEGNWQDIDFGMKLTQTRGISTYTNTTGTSFAANYVSNQPIMSMSGEDTAIDMTFIYAGDGAVSRSSYVTTAKAEVTQADTEVKTYADAQNVDFSNTLYYKDVMPGVDLEYIVDPWNVKENIIVKKMMDAYTYRFQLNMEGLYPVLQADGSVFLLNTQTDEREYVIPAPYMYDAYGEMSFDVDYTITGGNGTWYLSVAADDSWINAEDRVFPITIDPSISTHTDYAIMDTYITGDLPNEARGMHKFLFVGENKVAYIKVPAPSFSFDIEINEAHLAMKYFYKDFVKSGYVDVTAHRVTELVWLEEFLTWQTIINRGLVNFGLQSVAQGDAVRTYGTVGATSASPKPVNIDITSAVKGWVEYGITNDGIGLKYVTESPNRSVMFRSKEGPAQYMPRLVYNYTVIPTVNLILEYDEGYLRHYGEKVDETHYSEVNVLTRLNEVVDGLKEFFSNKYGIVVNYDTPCMFISYADKCPAAKQGGSCNCTGLTCFNGLANNNHHTNIYGVLYSLITPAPGYVRMAFVSHNFCEGIYDGETWSCGGLALRPPCGMAVETRGVMLIKNSNDIVEETITAIHEMGHMFGIKDHYYDSDDDDDNLFSTDEINAKYPGYNFDETCLYGENRGNMTSIDSIKICDGCRKWVEENKYWYNTQG